MADNPVNLEEIRRLLTALRKPDLHECLERLNMRKSGNKPELQQRLLDIFEDPYNLIANGHGPPRDMMRIVAAQRVIEDVHRKLSGVSIACTNGGSGGSGGEDVKYSSAAVTANTLLAGAMTAFFRERSTTATAAGTPQVTAAQSTVRCPCGAQPERLPQVVCRGCGWLQHRQCVGLDSRPAGRGELFFCEVCRAKRADPFWEVEDSSVTPAIRLSSTGKQSSVNGVMHHVRSAERTFVVTPAHVAKFRGRSTQGDYQLQLACLQLGDPVTFRFHWPLSADLRINNVQYRVYSRTGTQKLGANARDEPANIGQLWSNALGGRFHVSMQCMDNVAYVMLVMLVRRRSTEAVRGLMAPQLSLRDSVERACHQLAGDDDDELQTGATVVSLRCPILGTRMRTPARFSEVPGLACFDLGAFLDSAARTRKWQCPISMMHSSLNSLQIDTYMQRIVKALSDYPAVMEVEVEADGSWRPAGWRERFFSVEEDTPLSGSAALGSGGGGGGGGGGSSSSEETDEEEELRRAAAAVSAAAAAGQKRKRPPSPDVIDLASSDDEDNNPDAQRTNANGSAQPVPVAVPSTSAMAAAGGSSMPPQQQQQQQAAADNISGAGRNPYGAQQTPLRIKLGRQVITTTGAASITHRPQQLQQVQQLLQSPQTGCPGNHATGQGARTTVTTPPPAVGGSAVAAAEVGIMSTHRPQITGGALLRNAPHPQQQRPHASAPGPLMVTTGGVVAVHSVEAAAGAVGTRSTSIRQPLTSTHRPLIRMRMPEAPSAGSPVTPSAVPGGGCPTAWPQPGSASGAAAMVTGTSVPPSQQPPPSKPPQYAFAAASHSQAVHRPYQPAGANQLEPPSTSAPAQHHQQHYHCSEVLRNAYQQQQSQQQQHHHQQQQQQQQQQKSSQQQQHFSQQPNVPSSGGLGTAVQPSFVPSAQAAMAVATGSLAPNGVAVRRACAVEMIDLLDDDSADES